MQVQQEELIEFLVMSSQQYGMDPNQFAQSLDQEGQIPAMVAEVARRKALASVLEKVAVKDTAGNVIDLNEAVPGTEGDDDVEVIAEESIETVEAQVDEVDAADDTEAEPTPDRPRTRYAVRPAPAREPASRVPGSWSGQRDAAGLPRRWRGYVTWRSPPGGSHRDEGARDEHHRRVGRRHGGHRHQQHRPRRLRTSPWRQHGRGVLG